MTVKDDNYSYGQYEADYGEPSDAPPGFTGYEDEHSIAMAGIHESSTCTLGSGGGPCDLCRMVNESEAQRMEREREQEAGVREVDEAGEVVEASESRKSTLTNPETEALLEIVIRRARADLNDGGPLTEIGVQRNDPAVLRRIQTAMQRDRQYASLTVVRAAVADVLDAGYQFKNHAKPCPWLFFHDESDGQTEVREQFMDAVTTRIVQLQAPPHEMDARLQAEVERVRKGKM